MNPLTKQDVIDIIKEFNKSQGGTKGGFSVPRHQHNGSDMIKVRMGDLAPDIKGLQFTSVKGFININSTPLNSTDSLFTIENNDGTATGNDNQFTMSPTTTFITISNLAGNNVDYGFSNTSIQITATLPWKIHLPVNASLPLLPVAGDVCFFGGHLQVCEITGTWTAL